MKGGQVTRDWETGDGKSDGKKKVKKELET